MSPQKMMQEAAAVPNLTAFDSDALAPEAIAAQQAWWLTKPGSVAGTASVYAVEDADITSAVEQVPMWTEAVLQTASQWLQGEGLEGQVGGSFRQAGSYETIFDVVVTLPASVGVPTALDAEESLREVLFAEYEQDIAVRVVRTHQG